MKSFLGMKRSFKFFKKSKEMLNRIATTSLFLGISIDIIFIISFCRGEFCSL